MSTRLLTLLFCLLLGVPLQPQLAGAASYSIMCPETIDAWVMDGIVKRGDCYCPSRNSEPVCNFSSASGSGGSVPRPGGMSTDAQIAAFVTGFAMQTLINMAFAPTQGNDEQARAQAAWEQQQLKLKMEQEQRAKTAASLRSYWDRQDREMEETLGGVFSDGGGTDFFGTGGGMPSSSGGVKIGGERVAILGSGAPDAPLPAMVRPLASDPSALQQRLLEQGKDGLREIGWEIAKKWAQKALIPKSWENAKLAAEHLEAVNDFSGDLISALDPERLARAAASTDPRAAQPVFEQLAAVERKSLTLGMSNNPLIGGELEAGYKLLNGKALSRQELQSLGYDRAKETFVDWLTDRLVGGD